MNPPKHEGDCNRESSGKIVRHVSDFIAEQTDHQDDAWWTDARWTIDGLSMDYRPVRLGARLQTGLLVPISFGPGRPGICNRFIERRETRAMTAPMLDQRKIELLDDAMVAVLSAKTPAERLAMAFDCNRTARLVIAGHWRALHPDWTEGQFEAGVAGRMLDGAT